MKLMLVGGRMGEIIEFPYRAAVLNRSIDDWIDTGLKYENEGNLEEAVSVYERALIGYPFCPDIYFHLGNVLAELWRKEEAAERFLRAVKLDSGHAGAWNNLGTVLEMLGHKELAILSYERAIFFDPTFSDAHFNLGISYYNIGQKEEAVENFRRYLGLNKYTPNSGRDEEEIRAFIGDWS